MFNFFRKKKAKVTINSISIPHFGCNKVEENDSRIVWVNPEQSTLISLNFFDIQPDIPTVKDLGFLKKFYRRNISTSNSGIIEVALLDIHHIPGVKTIFKIPQPEGGMTYISSITIPFENCSFVVKVQAAEVDVTGIRDAFVLEKLLSSGEINFENDQLQNWFEDPYDPTFKEGTPMNRSEHEQYDVEFPQHPLSIARALINQAGREIIFKPEIKELAAFRK